ncbi:HTH-type transcriptional regulator YesS [Clostridium puniceum]|uniref:HTH-type transcriptional regulator YesS n=1 Tax=Clostridium puniceum TaxID=29367 RepID=A0A1S8TMC3_9CLOT|nr:AraC family transcriptional regulator [Clostridium puniceum]OOM78784.1 HTH-type transcriptional regulator YesS [Clostridium puniceum]
MNKLKNIYLNNLIVQFLLSYTIVLILPLIILVCGFKSAFNVTEQDISESNITMLSHSKSLLDIQIKAMESKALQISQNSRISDLAEKKKVDSSFLEEASSVIDEYYNLMRYQEVNLVEDSYIYMNNSDYVIYQNALYKLGDFENSIKNKNNLSLNELKKICDNNKDYVPYYTNINGNLQYIKPFATEMNGDVVGVIIFNINEYKLKKVLNFDDKSNERSVFIYNNEKELIWSEDFAGYKEKLNRIDLPKEGLVKDKDLFVITSKSNVTDWNFIVVIPAKIAMSKLNQLTILVIVLIFLALALGIGLALYMSIKKGKPINEMFNIYIDNNIPRNFKNLGGIVSKIVQNNQALLEEIELDKPMLKHEFLTKLVKGDFVNDKELNILAKKVGIEINCTKFRVVSFRLFLNNDLYEVDSQTLEEVQVLVHLIQKHIMERTKKIVWFYERDYLTTLAIFHINEDNQEDNVKALVEEVQELMLKEYSVDTAWGISCICKNILDIWRACEEAKVANLNYEKQRVTKYSKELDDKEEMYYPELFQEKIINSIRAADISNLDSLIDILQKENFNRRNISGNMMLELHNRIMLTLSSNFILSGVIQGEINKINEIIKEQNIEKDTYFKQLKFICQYLCKEMQKKKTFTQNKLIQKIVSYINEQYMNSNLGLALIASKFNISEGYVSTIFKGNMGVNFADYVEKVRIDSACNLLENSNDTINTISEKVGYNSVQSFRRAFKKVKGISPKGLRNVNK